MGYNFTEFRASTTTNMKNIYMKTLHTTSLHLVFGLLLAIPAMSMAATNSCTQPNKQCDSTISLTATIPYQVTVSNLQDVDIGRDGWSGSTPFYSPLMSFCVYSNSPTNGYKITFSGTKAPSASNDWGYELQSPSAAAGQGFKYSVKFAGPPPADPVEAAVSGNPYPAIGSGSQTCADGIMASIELTFKNLNVGSGLPNGFYTDTLNVLVIPN